jgi:hypothetical protein
MQNRIFYSICFGFVMGVLLRSFIFINIYTAIWLGVISFVLILFFSFILKSRWGIVVGIFILTFSLGILRFHGDDKPAPEVFESKVSQRVSFGGQIVDAPDIRENNQKLTVLAKEGEEETKILLSVGLGEDL